MFALALAAQMVAAPPALASNSYGGANNLVRAMRRRGSGSADTTSTRFALTNEPLWLALGVTKMKGEFRLTNWLSGAVSLAGGPFVWGPASLGVGAQLNVYLVGGFDRGVSVGANAMGFGPIDNPKGMIGSGAGLVSYGGHLGLKTTRADRVVLEVQLGAMQVARNDFDAGASLCCGTAQPSWAPSLGLFYGWAY
jgi:hypothetical protein